jgi:uncharacterized protein YjbJ (UPF0337 family)
VGLQPHSPRQVLKEDLIMDKDRVQVSARQVVGGIKEVVGKVLGDQKTESEGKAEKATGKIQNAVGGIKAALKKYG